MSIRQFAYKWRREILSGVFSGFLLAVSFPPYPFRFVSLFALVPLMWFFIRSGDCDSGRGSYLKRGFVAGFASGLAFFGILLYWIANVIPASSVTMRWVLVPGVSLLVIYLSCFPGLFGMSLAFLVKRYGARGLIAAPALWSLTEIVRSSGELAFSWGSLSSAMARYPVAIQSLSVYGPYGFSFLIVLVNIFIAFVIFVRPPKLKVISFIILTVIVAAHIVFGMLRIEKFDEDRSNTAREGSIAVIQPNVSLEVKWKQDYKDAIFHQIDSLTEKASAEGAELVIFPETSAPVAINRSLKYKSWLEAIARNSEVELLVGYINHSFKDGVWKSHNSAGLFSDKGKLEVEYHKVNLLPFGESIPFSQYIPALEKIDFGQANFKSGEKRALFNSQSGEFGVLICFESTFPGYVRNYVRDGASYLVNITNDGWFGSNRGPLQHSETAILRAVENGVTVLRSANTGVSMWIDPVGRVKKRIELNIAGEIEASTSSFAAPTLYVKYGNTLFFILAVLSLAAAVINDPSRLLKRSESK